MSSIKILAVAAAACFLLAGCEGYKYVGTDVCNQEGAVVWYIKPNSQGRVDTANISQANCTLKK